MPPYPDDGGDQVDWRAVAESLFLGVPIEDAAVLQLLADAYYAHHRGHA